MAENRHPGISMHKLDIGPGFVGLLFTVGCALIFLFGLPALWSFVAFSAALGIAIALLLRWSSSRRSERMKPLSIFQPADKVVPITRGKNHRISFRIFPKLYPA